MRRSAGPGFPSLGASVAFERPQRFRLRAGTGLTGTEFDLGSNDELFWFWLRRNQPPAVYYCRHDQFAASPARQTMPFEPGWLIEALGVAELDPALPHQGPTPLPNDRLRIDTIRNTPDGPVTKITILDGSQGWVLEQYVFDARRQLLASSVASGHRRDPLSGLVMPTRGEHQLPAGPIGHAHRLGQRRDQPAFRRSGQSMVDAELPGAPLVNLADPNFRWPTGPAPVAASARRTRPSANWQRPAR